MVKYCFDCLKKIHQGFILQEFFKIFYSKLHLETPVKLRFRIENIFCFMEQLSLGVGACSFPSPDAVPYDVE